MATESASNPGAVLITGASTGIGGVIRDPLGTGLGAKPIANTDVFCFAPPDLPSIFDLRSGWPRIKRYS